MNTGQVENNPKVYSVPGRVTDLGDNNGLVVYVENGNASQYFVPRDILKRDGVDEKGAEFLFNCRKDAGGQWRGNFVRTPGAESDENWSKLLKDVQPHPIEELF
ncbi:MAG: hypothetical protein AABX11_01245 [Nanoarchaeota archaeon]